MPATRYRSAVRVTIAVSAHVTARPTADTVIGPAQALRTGLRFRFPLIMQLARDNATANRKTKRGTQPTIPPPPSLSLLFLHGFHCSRPDTLLYASC
ncbi:hypothetical protein WH47_00969 [Habropoda laboriosa]|uniref:Uncharacterized protein n=1 Tax=Habropoda laboriosa TaxID=597456 RepID=A0A0L7R5N6_9HYME|nr:hypothetical protein WH47_00969 [Habropoda laboriosa]